MKDKHHYHELMSSVIEDIGFPVADVGLFKKRVYGGPEFASAKVGEITSSDMWQQIFADADLLPEQRATLSSSSTSLESEGSIGAPRRRDRAFSAADVERMRDHVRLHGRHVHPELIEYISQLKARSIRVAVLSNYESDLLHVFEGLGIRELFGDEMIVSSHDLRAAKPKKESFFRALKRLQISPTPLLDDPTATTAETVVLRVEPSNGNHVVAPSTPLDAALLSASSTLDEGSPDTPSCALSPLPPSGRDNPPPQDAASDDFFAGGFFPNVIFVDDKESNVEGAKRCGVPRSIVYKNLHQCIQDIEAHLTAIDSV